MRRRAFLLIIGLLCCWPRPSAAKPEETTLDQVIARYLAAIGADRFPTINTFVERGEIQDKITDPNVFNPGRISRYPNRAQTGSATYQFYYKSPNLRFSSTITSSNVVMALYGCNGKVSWFIDSSLKRTEHKPKPDQQYDCANSLEPELSPLPLHDPHAKMKLAGTKKLDGREMWEVKVDSRRSNATETFLFDPETSLLVRFGTIYQTTTYSDYRDIGGFKRPFTIVQEFSNGGKIIQTVRDIQINAPIDGSRFVEPEIRNGGVVLNPAAPAPKAESADAPTTPAPQADPQARPASATPAATEINFPNYTTCTVAELQSYVPELHGLKPAPDQTELGPLLSKVGATLLGIAHNTPNLISHEVVTDSLHRGRNAHRDYDYLILTRVEGDQVFLNEYRVDLKTGDKFQIDDVEKPSAASTPIGTGTPGSQADPAQLPRHPASQGFAVSWVDFYPYSQLQSAFRYLGEQKIDGHVAIVLAFAQKPEAVHSPGLFRHDGKSSPMYFQGVAWFDASDFQILRMRTDLLAPVPEASLLRLTADVQFAPTRIPDVSTVLPLPRDVSVTTVAFGSTVREQHSYSDYRLFRAKSRLVLNP